jgi:LuxR family maltose regulon positive regulatory protein
MAVPLLTTKLYIPAPRPGAVPRSRLVECLEEGRRLDHRLCVVCAPAGSGKTTLLAEWLQCLSMPGGEAPVPRVAWLSLDEPDNDPSRFFAYLVAALQRADSTIGRDLPGALPAAFAPAGASGEAVDVKWVEAPMTLLINDIAATSAPLLLILDDYHLITQLGVHAAVSFLVEHTPPNMQLVIATRQDPPLPLSRARARGYMTELRAADLRFSRVEVTAFLNQTMDLDLTPEQVAALEFRTEGWIAGLQLAALALQGASPAPRPAERAAFIQAFSGNQRHVMDFLVDEVLSRQPEAVQRFLLQTSILDRLNGPLCDAVLTDLEPETLPISSSSVAPPLSSSQRMLHYLDASNLFVVALDDRREWYRYHQLFADLLRHRLRQVYPGLVRDLHCRASTWYEQQLATQEEPEAVDRAISHALSGEDYERAARLLEENHAAMIARGDLGILYHWADAIPRDILRHRPWLCIFCAWGLSWWGRLDEADILLEYAARHITPGDSSPETCSMLAHISYVRARGAGMRGDLPLAIELARVARQHMPQQSLVVRASVETLLGYLHLLSGDLAQASQVLQEGLDLSQAAGALNAMVALYCLLAEVRRLQGRLREADQLYDDALQLVRAHSGQHPGAEAVVAIGQADVRYEWNDLSAAATCIQYSIEHIQWWGKPDDQVQALVTLARVRCAEGDLDAADDALNQAAHILQSGGLFPDGRGAVENAHVRLCLARGDVAGASRWAETHGLAETDRLTYEREAWHISLARVCLAQGRYPDALSWLQRLAGAAEAAGRTGRLIEILVLQALALYAQSQAHAALDVLQRALALAAPEGYVRLFVDEGAPMAELLRLAAARGLTPNYVARLLDALTASLTPARPSAAAHPLDVQVEPLTERELDVLRLVAQGASNRVIAERLVVTTGTVKTHVSHIMSKLDACNRTEAAARARELGLL